MSPQKIICDHCRQKTASVFVTRIAHGQTAKHCLCDKCARVHTTSSEWQQDFQNASSLQSSAKPVHSRESSGGVSHYSASEKSLTVSDLIAKMSAADLIAGHDDCDEAFEIFGEDAGKNTSKNTGEDELEPMDVNGAFFETCFENDAQDEKQSQKGSEDESDLDGPIYHCDGSISLPITGGYSNKKLFAGGEDSGGSHSQVQSARCTKCGTTWDRLREDGRAGCAHCYVAFHDKLIEVMEKMQRDSHHTGKSPRTAQKRHRRLEQLRKKRDHRLEMLQGRLQQALDLEKYEDAARLRDQIKIVSSTIVEGG